MLPPPHVHLTVTIALAMMVIGIGAEESMTNVRGRTMIVDTQLEQMIIVAQTEGQTESDQGHQDVVIEFVCIIMTVPDSPLACCGNISGYCNSRIAV